MSVEDLAEARAAARTSLRAAPVGLASSSPERLSATYDHAGIGIVEVDERGTFLRVNAGLCELMGYAEHELLGRTIFEEAIACDTDLDREQLWRQAAGEFERYSIEKQIRRKDGSLFWASITSSSVRDAAGRFLYAVRVQYDITGRKRAEDALAKRVVELGALYDFSARLQQAGSLGEVYEAGLDAILRALTCQRAAILLFDQTGTMRFVASRGLSETYRRKVEGHSPWSPDEPDPQPICLPDVNSSELAPELKRIVKDEGVSGVAFIPMQENSRLLGKVMAYYDNPHAFGETEIGVAVTIGRQLGIGVARMHAEAVRRQVERASQQLVLIVESSDDAIISKDLQGVITTWNRAAERIFGYSAAEAIGRPVTMLIPQERLNEEPGIMERIRRGARIDHYETVRRRKDGTLIDLSLTVSPMRDSKGRIIGASKIARDITERKLAEARLQASERRLQELMAAIPAAIYTTDAEGRITYYNEAAVALAGRTPVIGSDQWCVTWKLFLPDGTPLPHAECPMAVALREGRAIRDAEAVAERPDGTRVPFIPYPTPLRDENGNVVGAINMLVDISERRQAETQQRLLLNELNHRVKNNMQMLQSLLSAATLQTQNPDARRVLGEASNRLAAMSAAQRVLYGTANATRFPAADFLNAVCLTVQQTLDPGITVECHADPQELPNDIAMPLALILNELVTNAVKHGLKGRHAGAVRVNLVKEAEGHLLQVEDDGPGFDLESARKRSSGLSLIQGLARQLRGRFEVIRNQAVTRCELRFS